MIGIISFVTIFGLYTKFKREGLIQSPSELKKKNLVREELGFLMLIYGLIFTISAYGFSFILTTTTDYCIVDGILDSINKTKLQECISKNSNFNMLIYHIGFAGVILLTISSFLLSSVTFKKSRI